MSGDSPIVGPITAGELRQFLANQPALEPATIDDLDQHIAAISLATAKAKTSRAEAKARIELFWRVLRGCTRNDLRRGVDKWIRENKWMPTPAELCNAVGQFRTRREYALSRAAYLIGKHEREWAPPKEIMGGEDLAALTADLATRFPSQRAPDPSLATAPQE